MKQTLGRQVGEVREHECNMHVCVGVRVALAKTAANYFVILI